MKVTLASIMNDMFDKNIIKFHIFMHVTDQANWFSKLTKLNIKIYLKRSFFS